MFAFVGGNLFGPPAHTTTTQAIEKHTELAMMRRTNGSLAWHDAVRRFYWHHPKPPLRWFALHSTHLVVHVRRGDVSFTSQRRFLSNGLVAACIMGALAHYPQGTAVHITSEGRVADFGPLAHVPNVRFHLNEPLLETFNHMASASGLVIAASTLSATAAFLVAGRGGKVFAHPTALTMLRYAYDGLGVRDCMANARASRPLHAVGKSAVEHGRRVSIHA